MWEDFCVTGQIIWTELRSSKFLVICFNIKKGEGKQRDQQELRGEEEEGDASEGRREER